MDKALRGVLNQLSDIQVQGAGSAELPLILQALNMIAERLEANRAEAKAEANTPPPASTAPRSMK